MFRIAVVWYLLALCALAAYAEKVTFSGTVVESTGKPVAEARVAVSSTWTQDFFSVGECFVTNEHGVFSFTVDTPVPKDFPFPRYVNCVIAAPGYALQVVDITQDAPKTVTLQQGITSRGTVVDSAGTPLHGVRVRAVSFTNQIVSIITMPPALEDQYACVTDEQGVWTITGLPVQEVTHFRVDDQRYVSVLKSNGTFADNPFGFEATSAKSRHQPETVVNDPLVLTAVPGVRVRGRVVQPDGTPLAGILVAGGNVVSRRVITGDDGVFELPGLDLTPLAWGKVMLNFHDREQQWRFPAPCFMPKVKSEGVTDVGDVTLYPTIRVEGQVVDAKTNKPIKDYSTLGFMYKEPDVHTRNGAEALSTPPDSPNMDLLRDFQDCPRIFTDADGRFQVALLPGQYLVHIDRHHHNSIEGSYASAEVKPNQTDPLVLTVDKAIRPNFIVQDEQGKRQGKVDLSFVSPVCKLFHWDGQSNLFGSLVIQEMPRIVVQVTAISDADAVKWEVVSPQRIDLATTTSGVITVRRMPRGRVVTPEGRPVPKALVEYEVTRLVHPTSLRSSAFPSTSVHSTHTDFGGYFYLASVKADDHVTITRVTHTSFVPVRLGTVTPTEQRFHITDSVMLQCLETLSGQVLDVAGKPLAEATVISPCMHRMLRTVTDADGRFTLKKLPPGEIRVIAASRTQIAIGKGSAGHNGLVLTARAVPTPLESYNVQAVAALLRADWQRPQQERRIDHDWALRELAAHDFALACEIAKEEEREVTSEMRLNYLKSVIARDPEQLPIVAVDQIELIDDSLVRFDAAIAAGIALVKDHPLYAEHCYRVATSIIPVSDTERQDGRQYALFSLAGLLKKDEAKTMFSVLQGQARQKQGRYYYRQLCIATARFNSKLAEDIWSGLDEQDRYHSLEGVCAVLADQDATEAARLLRIAARLKSDEYNTDAVARVVVAVAKTDPEGAIALAREVARPSQLPDLLLELANHLPKDHALVALHEADKVMRKEGGRHLYRLKQMASLSFRLDPTLSQRLIDEFRTAFDQGQLDPYLAAEISRVDLMRGHLLLEEHYAKAMAGMKGDTGNVDWFISGMYLLDPARAEEMHEEAYALAPDTVRGAYYSFIRNLLSTENERSGFKVQ